MDSRPRWQVVYEELRSRIDQGEFKPGDQLPTEHDLMKRFDCSRPTVRRAFTQLEQAGIVSGRPSVGRVVRQRMELYFDATKFERIYADDPERNLDQWAQDVVAQGWEPQQTVELSWWPASVRLARWLDVEPRTRLVRRRRLRMVRKLPERDWTTILIADSWFPEDIASREVDGFAPLLAERNVTLRGGIIRAIGIRQVQFRDEIRARMPSDEETRLLMLPVGTPVLEFARIGIDDTGRHIRVITNTIAGDRQHLRYELDVPQPDQEADQ